MIMTRHSMARVSSASFDEDYCGAVPTMVAFNWESAPGKPLKPLPKSSSISKRTSTSSVDKSPLPLPPGRRILQQSHLQSFSGPLFPNSSVDAAPTKPSSKQSWGHKLVRNHVSQGIIRSQSYGSDGELDIDVEKKIGSERSVSTRFNPAVMEVNNCASGRRNASATLTDLVELTPVILPPVGKLHAMDDLLQLEVAQDDEEDEPLPLPPGRRPKDGFYLQYPRPVECVEAYESSGKPRDPRRLHAPKKLKKLLGWSSKQQFNSAGRVSSRDARDAGDVTGEEEGSIKYLDGTNSQESEVAERFKARLSKKIAALRRNRPHIRKCFHFEGGSSTSPAVRSPRVHHSHFSGSAEEQLSRGRCRPHSSSTSRRKIHKRSLTLSSVKNPCLSEVYEEKSDLSELHTSVTAVNESTSSSSSGHDTSRISNSSPDTNSSLGLGCTSNGAAKLHHHVADPYACFNFQAEHCDHNEQPGQKHQPSCKFMANMLISLCPSDGNEEFVTETLDASNSSSQLKEIASPQSLSARRNYSGSSSPNLNPILLSSHTESNSSPTLLKLPHQQDQGTELFTHQRTTSKVNFFCNSANSKDSLTMWRSAETEHQDGNFIPEAVFARGSNSTTKESLHQDSESMSDPSSKGQQLTQRYSVSEKSLTSPTIRSNHGHSELSRRSMMRSSSKLEQQVTLQATKFNEKSAQTTHVDEIKPTAGDPGDVHGEARKLSKSVRTTSPRISLAGSNSSSPKNWSHALGGEVDLISPNSSSRRSSSRLYSPSKLRSLTSESRNNSLPSQEDSLELENRHQQPIYTPEQIQEPVVLPPPVHIGDQNADNCRPQAGASSWMGQVLKAPSMWFKSPIALSNLRDEKPSDQSYSTSVEELDVIPGRGFVESTASDVNNNNNNLFHSTISTPKKLVTSWVVSQETMKSSPLVKFKLQHEQMYESPRSSFVVDDTRIVAALKDDVTQISASLRNSSQVQEHRQDQMAQNAAPHRPMSHTGNVNIHAKHPNAPDIFATATTSSTSLKLTAAPPKSVMSLVAQWESKAKGIGSPASTKSARPLTWKGR